jgi:hypothetical protein
MDIAGMAVVIMVADFTEAMAVTTDDTIKF